MVGIRLFFVAVVLIVTATAVGSTRIAILATGSDPQIGNVAAIVEASLAQGHDFVVLERQGIERILAEQGLSLSGLVEADQAVKVGKVLSCQLLAILEPESGASQFGMVIFDPATGVRLADAPVLGKAPEAAEVVITAIRTANRKMRSAADVRTVCLMTVRNADLPRDMDGFCDAVGRLVERNLIGSASIAILERARLEQVTRERALAADGASQQLLSSLVVVELQIERHAQGLQATALLSDTAGKVLGKVVGVSPTIDVSKMAAAVAAALTGNLKVPAAPQLDPLVEATRFHNEWDFRAQNRDYFRAVPPAEAAHALAPDNLLYHAALAEALIVQGHAQYRGPDFTPHSATQPWERHDLVPASLTRGAQMLAGLQPAASELKGPAADQVKRHFANAAAELRNFVASATWFQTNQTDRTPLPSSEVAAVKRSLRQYVLSEDVSQLAAVRDEETFRAYSAHLPELLSDNQWLYSVDPEQWTTDFESSARTWLALRSKYSSVTSQEAVDALDAIAVGWQFEKHRGTSFYGGGVNARTRRWDPDSKGLDRLSRIQLTLASDPAPLLQWYGDLMALSIEVTPLFNSPDRIHQCVGRFIEKMTAPLATAELARRPDLKRPLYHILIQADRLLDRSKWKGDYSGRLLDLSLSRHEVEPTVIARSVLPPRDSATPGPSDLERKIAVYERVLKAMEFPDCTVFEFENVTVARTVYLRELERLRHTRETGITSATTQPWYRSRQLIDVFHANEGLRALFSPIVDGDHVDVLGAQPMSEQVQTLRLQLLRFPLAGGPPQRMGMLPTQEMLNLQPDGFTIGSNPVRASCLAEGLYCAATWRDGILIFPTDGRFPRRLGLNDGLPDMHAGAIALMDGHIYGVLGVERSERYIIAYDLSSKQVDTIASSSRKDRRSPFDNQSGIDVLSLTADPPRHRLIAVVACGEKQPPLSGLWEFRPATGQWRYLLPVHWVQERNRERFSGTVISTILRPRNEVLLFAATGAVLFFDLRSDRAFTLSTLEGPNPVLPPQTPLWKTATAGLSELQHIAFGGSGKPRLLADPWLWGDWGRINLSSGQTQKLESLRGPRQPYGAFDMEPIGDGQELLLGDRMGLWVLTAIH